MTVCVAPGEIVSFWGDAGPDKWFEQDETFDQAKHPADLGRHRLDGRA
jgi:uncharacterized protein (DUF924 family)